MEALVVEAEKALLVDEEEVILPNLPLISDVR